MAVNLLPPQQQSIYPIAGVRLGVAQAGIRKANRYDLTLIELAPQTVVSGVFTQNRFCAAPVQVCREHLAQSASIRALLINTGIANAGTGEQGLYAANKSCEELANLLHIDAQQVLPFSTGVIMEPLPVNKLVQALPQAVANLQDNHWLEAAQAIMTTDTVAKAYSKKIDLNGQQITITGISKGSGMIHPNMATMLGFIATDAKLTPRAAQQLVREAVEQSFNRITIDGDTSTNDSFVLMATQQQGPEIDDLKSAHGQLLASAVIEVASQLAQAMVRDGEGATKFITITVKGGKTQQECLQVAFAIAHSPLVKTAFFASDPNLGRILAAVGYAGIPDMEQQLIELYLDDVHVVTQGGRNPAYCEEEGQRVMAKSEIRICVDLNRGKACETVWTCDLSHDYVSINADYRS